MNGMIHEKVDLKVLILYVMSRLPAPVYPETVFDICICDNGVEYFDFTECFYELVESEHIAESDDEFFITEKGKNNCKVLESALPYSVRRAADSLMAPEIEKLRRLKMIKAEYETSANGCIASFSLSDGISEIMKMSILCAGEEQAKKMKKNFRRNAEEYYNKIVEMFSDNEGKKIR